MLGLLTATSLRVLPVPQRNDRSLNLCETRLGLPVVKYFGVGQAGGVADNDVHVLPATSSLAS